MKVSCSVSQNNMIPKSFDWLQFKRNLLLFRLANGLELEVNLKQ